MDELRRAIKQVQITHPFIIKAFVVLPEHLHAIWEMPDGDFDYSKRWAQVKRYFTNQLIAKGYEFEQGKDGVYHLWQRRFWEHLIRDEKDLENHINYIHYNPVKHGLVLKVKDWPYSTLHQHIKKGWLEESWGEVGFMKLEEGFGER